MFAYAANNPIKYTDPDGRLTIKDFSKMSYTAITTEFATIYGFPLGGDWTSSQKDMLKLQNFTNLFLGFGDTKGDNFSLVLTFMQGLTFEGSPSDYWNLTKSLVGMMVDTEKKLGSWIAVTVAFEELMECLVSDPSVNVTNYTNSHIEFLSQVYIEQKFINDLCTKLEDEGIFSKKTYDGTFIMNVEFVTNSSCFADNVGKIKRIAEELKKSNPDLYSKIQIE